MGRLELVSLTPSRRKDKKWAATFVLVDDDGKSWRDVSHFGGAGYDDFTTTGDVKRREQYRRRHEKDLKSRFSGQYYYTQPGVLAYHLLWGDSPDLQKNLRVYRRMMAS